MFIEKEKQAIQLRDVLKIEKFFLKVAETDDLITQCPNFEFKEKIANGKWQCRTQRYEDAKEIPTITDDFLSVTI